MPIVTALPPVAAVAVAEVGALVAVAEVGALVAAAAGADADGEAPLEQAATRATEARPTPKIEARRLMRWSTVVHTPFLVTFRTRRGTIGGGGRVSAGSRRTEADQRSDIGLLSLMRRRHLLLGLGAMRRAPGEDDAGETGEKP